MVQHDDTFPAAYAVEEKDPQSAAPDVQFVADGASRLAPVFSVLVAPAGAQAWNGEFFGGRDSLCRLVNGPDPQFLIAVAGGVGYVVPVHRPNDYSVIPLRPVVDARPAPTANLVICVGLTALAAIGRDGNVVWASSRLVADGFHEVRITSSAVVARGRNLSSQRETEITLDLASGVVVARE